MAEGVNFYFFISAIVFSLGLYTLLSSKNAVRITIGIILLFSASVINITSISGINVFNPEGQILVYLISGICLLNVSTGIILFFTFYKKYSSNNIIETKIID